MFLRSLEVFDLLLDQFDGVIGVGDFGVSL